MLIEDMDWTFDGHPPVPPASYATLAQRARQMARRSFDLADLMQQVNPDWGRPGHHTELVFELPDGGTATIAVAVPGHPQAPPVTQRFSPDQELPRRPPPTPEEVAADDEHFDTHPTYTLKYWAEGTANLRVELHDGRTAAWLLDWTDPPFQAACGICRKPVPGPIQERLLRPDTRSTHFTTIPEALRFLTMHLTEDHDLTRTGYLLQ